jgi:hypothetical protein
MRQMVSRRGKISGIVILCSFVPADPSGRAGVTGKPAGYHQQNFF